MQKECSADLFGFAHVEARGGGWWRRLTAARSPEAMHQLQIMFRDIVRLG